MTPKKIAHEALRSKHDERTATQSWLDTESAARRVAEWASKNMYSRDQVEKICFDLFKVASQEWGEGFDHNYDSFKDWLIKNVK